VAKQRDMWDQFKKGDSLQGIVESVGRGPNTGRQTLFPSFGLLPYRPIIRLQRKCSNSQRPVDQGGPRRLNDFDWSLVLGKPQPAYSRLSYFPHWRSCFLSTRVPTSPAISKEAIGAETNETFASLHRLAIPAPPLCGVDPGCTLDIYFYLSSRSSVVLSVSPIFIVVCLVARLF
jgi:hypothetical protein